ncbi:MAG: prefoldin subunit beta [Candidatus Aenigmatarchaeota archaeon]
MLSEQDQQLLAQAQMYQQQLQMLASQKENINMQLVEMKKAQEELEKNKENELFKVVGPLLIKTDNVSMRKELAEKKDVLELRLKTLDKNEKKLQITFEELREKLSKKL